MTIVCSFNLKQGTRIGNYRILKTIGRGCEAEVYKVAEVPTGAIRVLKLFRAVELESVKQFIHYAQYYEELRPIGHFPIYYTYGQWFSDQYVNCWFLILEFIKGTTMGIKIKNQPIGIKEKLFFILIDAVANVHEHGYAIGDFSNLDNVIITQEENIIFVDCEPGLPGKPNRNFRNDCETEIPEVVNSIFYNAIPLKVEMVMKKLESTRRFNRRVLRSILKSVDKTKTQRKEVKK